MHRGFLQGGGGGVFFFFGAEMPTKIKSTPDPDTFGKIGASVHRMHLSEVSQSPSQSPSQSAIFLLKAVGLVAPNRVIFLKQYALLLAEK